MLRGFLPIAICLICLHTGMSMPFLGKADSLIKVLVLTPHDAIANAGVSPDTKND